MELHDKIQRLLAAPDYRPLKRKEIARALRLSPQERNELSRALSRMESRGEIVRVRKERYVLPSEADLVTGRLQMHERGFGFVVPELDPQGRPTAPSDIFIHAENTWVGMHGDRVVARLIKGSTRRDRAEKSAAHLRQSGQRAEGRVIRILERAHRELVGTLQQTRLLLHVVPDDPRLIHNIYVQPHPRARVGDKVVVQLFPWESRHVNPEGKIIEVLGPADQAGMDMIALIRKHRLPQKFPEEVEREAMRLPTAVPEQDKRGRLDLRDQFILTIDPDDAKDFDDAVQVDALPHGGWRLGVHIADVSHYVHPQSALDREALSRGNSVYLVDRVIPMLPETLSNGLCSLVEGEDRLVKSCFLEFDAQGKVRKTEFADSLIRSRKRLSYQQALTLLEDKRDSSELARELKKMWRLAALLRKNRFAAGSLALDFPEVKVLLDKHGRAFRLEKVENDISHQLIEEFMLAANQAVGKLLRQRFPAAIFRVHENPKPEKLEEFRTFAAGFGYKVGDISQRRELQKLLEAIEGRPEAYVVRLALLRSLMRARYDAQPLGHYGLAKSDYTHFTSPIRRYPDLVAHRLLSLATRPGRSSPHAASQTQSALYDAKTLQFIAQHCSETERRAQEAEEDSVKMKTLEFFQRQLQEHKLDDFDAVIVEVRNFGFFVELTDTLVYGLVHISTVEDDFYDFDPARARLVGKRSRRVFRAGDRVRVRVARVDTFKQQIDFCLAQEPPSGRIRAHRRR